MISPLLLRARAVFIGAALLTTLTGSRFAAARPADPWPGPKGAYIFVEAEEMTLQGKGWAVEDVAPHAREGSPSNLKSLGGDRAGNGTATQAIDIPEAGTYQIWVRFNQELSQDAKSRGPFQVDVAQEGKDAATHEFDQSYEGKEGTKHLPEAWRWEKFSADLRRGPATLALRKTGPEKTPHGARQIDCLLLTTDAGYQPDERDFAPQTYFRIRLIQADLKKLYFYGFIDHMHAPWYHNIAIGRDTLNSSVTVKTGALLSAGESTGWVNLSRLLYADSDSNLTLMATLKYHNPDAASSRYAVDFATAPEEVAIVSSYERNGAGCGMSMRIPPDLLQGREPKFDLQVTGENLRVAEQLTPPAFGKVPTRFPILIGLTMLDKNTSAGTRERELKVARILGFNGTSGHLDPADIPAGFQFGRTSAHVWYMGPGGFDEPLLDKMKGFVDQDGKTLAADPLRDHYLAAQIMDEATPPTLATMVGQPAHEAAFVAWLREQGRTPKDLGVDSWDAVKLTADRAAPNPSLYFESERFRAWSIAHFFKQSTGLIRQAFPAGARSSQNFSDGVVYVANFYSQGNDYFTWFRNEALELAWSEDWTNGGSTPQLCGWNVALLRAATREHGQPIGMYVIASHPTPLDVKLKAYSDIAQGAKILDIYSYTPPYQGHEGSWYLKAPTYAAIAELTHEIGAAEDILLDAQPRPAETAIIYSRAYDIWTVGVDNIEGQERMHTYLALRHAQTAVDVLDEDDVAAGKLKGRRVAYLFGEQLDRRAVEPLTQWVKDGGTLILSPAPATATNSIAPVSCSINNSPCRASLSSACSATGMPAVICRYRWPRRERSPFPPATAAPRLPSNTSQCAKTSPPRRVTLSSQNSATTSPPPSPIAPAAAAL